jgi:hypothetical protein
MVRPVSLARAGAIEFASDGSLLCGCHGWERRTRSSIYFAQRHLQRIFDAPRDFRAAILTCMSHEHLDPWLLPGPPRKAAEIGVGREMAHDPWSVLEVSRLPYAVS